MANTSTETAANSAVPSVQDVRDLISAQAAMIPSVLATESALALPKPTSILVGVTLAVALVRPVPMATFVGHVHLDSNLELQSASGVQPMSILKVTYVSRVKTSAMNAKLKVEDVVVKTLLSFKMAHAFVQMEASLVILSASHAPQTNSFRETLVLIVEMDARLVIQAPISA